MACARASVSSSSGASPASAPASASASANTSTVYPYATIAGMKKKYPYKTALLGWFLDYY